MVTVIANVRSVDEQEPMEAVIEPTILVPESRLRRTRTTLASKQRKVTSNLKQKQKQKKMNPKQSSEQTSQDANDAPVYRVQCIRAHKSDKYGRISAFKVKWHGYNERHNSYVDVQELQQNCQQMVKQYLKRIGQ